MNDDKVGRALDAVFQADRASLLTELSLRVVRRYGIDVTELHNDSTSITLYGAYRSAIGEARAGVRPPVPARGYSKDHRGDLKQLAGLRPSPTSRVVVRFLSVVGQGGWGESPGGAVAGLAGWS